jgi:hypothetical protein
MCWCQIPLHLVFKGMRMAVGFSWRLQANSLAGLLAELLAGWICWLAVPGLGRDTSSRDVDPL